MTSRPPPKRSASPLPFAIGDARMAPSADPLAGKFFRMHPAMALECLGSLHTTGRVLHRFDELHYAVELWRDHHTETRLVPVEAFAPATTEFFDTEDELEGVDPEGNGAAAE